MWWRSLLLFAFWFTLPLAGGGDGALPPPPGPELRIERFVIYTRRTETGRAPTLDVAGFVEWRRRDTAEGPMLESDVRFLVGAPGPDHTRAVQRVLHVECAGERGPRCLWREIGPGAGRSVQAEWSGDGSALDVVEWSTSAKRRGTLVVSGGATMPLYLAELLRQGRLTAGHVVVFDPLALTLEPLEIKTVWLDAAAELGDAKAGEAPDSERGSQPAVRTSELRRADGSLAMRYRFRGRDLVAFQWQDGETYARATSESEYQLILAQHVEPLSAPAQDR